MEKKNQVYLSAFVTYLLAGFAGAIYSMTHNYWMILALFVLMGGFTAITIASKDTTTLKETLFDWISISAILLMEVVFTLLIEVAKLPFRGAFLYIYYIGQAIGFFLAGYSIVRVVLEKTEVVEVTKKIFTRKNKEVKVDVEATTTTNEVGTEVEATIAEETANQDAADVEVVGATEETETTDAEVVDDTQETEVLGIELQEATTEEVATPYMEEEIQ